jgi:hypothetical protein
MKINQTHIAKIPKNWKISTLQELSSIPISNGIYNSSSIK